MNEQFPSWPNSKDFEYVDDRQDKWGNVYPYVGYQYKAEAEYLRAWKAAAEPRLRAANIPITNL